MMDAVTIAAPAKLNLGLEILRKRSDGYHEILTVMAAIDLVDTISIRPTPSDDRVTIDGMYDVDIDDNLIALAIRRFAEATGVHAGYEISVEKRIPSPGGLGGASSDAASTLIALNAMYESPLSEVQLHELGASLGSDVPFFLGSSPALASGTGTELQTLPSMTGFVVLVSPTIGITSKTATLYGSLRPEDMSDGSRMEEVASLLRAGRLPDASVLANAFTRALYDLVPELSDLSEKMIAAGAPYGALSGAGPTHYVLVEREEEALQLAEELESQLSPDIKIRTAQFIDLPHDLG